MRLEDAAHGTNIKNVFHATQTGRLDDETPSQAVMKKEAEMHYPRPAQCSTNDRSRCCGNVTDLVSNSSQIFGATNVIGCRLNKIIHMQELLLKIDELSNKFDKTSKEVDLILSLLIGEFDQRTRNVRESYAEKKMLAGINPPKNKRKVESKPKNAHSIGRTRIGKKSLFSGCLPSNANVTTSPSPVLHSFMNLGHIHSTPNTPPPLACNSTSPTTLSTSPKTDIVDTGKYSRCTSPGLDLSTRIGSQPMVVTPIPCNVRTPFDGDLFARMLSAESVFYRWLLVSDYDPRRYIVTMVGR